MSPFPRAVMDEGGEGEDGGEGRGRTWIGFKMVRPAMLRVVSAREASVYGEETREEKYRLGRGKMKLNKW